MFEGAESEAGEHDPRERHLKEKHRDECGHRDQPCTGVRQVMARHPHQRGDDDGEHGRTHRAEECLHPSELSVNRIQCRRDRNEQHSRQDEEHTGRDGATQSVQLPSRIDDQLMRLGSGQEHAEIQARGELVRGEPAASFDQFLAQDGDLPRWPAETDPSQPRKETAGGCPVSRGFFLAILLHLFIVLGRIQSRYGRTRKQIP